MKVDKSLNLACRCRVIVLLALLDAKRSEHLSNCDELNHFKSKKQVVLTSLLFHFSTSYCFVQQTNAQPNIHTHPLLIDLPSKAILNQDVGGVRAELVASIPNLRDDHGVPLSLSLTCGHKTTHNEIVDLPPVRAGTCCDVGDDVSICPMFKRLVAEGAFPDLNNVFLASLVGEIVGKIVGVEMLALFSRRAHRILPDYGDI